MTQEPHGYQCRGAFVLVTALLAVLVFFLYQTDFSVQTAQTSHEVEVELKRFTVNANPDPTPRGPARIIRVLATQNEHVLSTLTPYGPGFERELLERFAEQYDYTLYWMQSRSPQEAWKALTKGEADLFIGLGFQPKEMVHHKVKVGPAYAHYRPVAVSTKSPGSGEFCPDTVLVSADTSLREDMIESKNCGPARRHLNSSELPTLLGNVSSRKSAVAMVDQGRFRLWQPFFPKLKAVAPMGQPVPYRWYWSEGRPGLARDLALFWKSASAKRTLTELTELYFGFLPEESDPYALRQFYATVQRGAAQWGDDIIRVSKKYEIDPLLLMALIYQESRFDPHAVSPTGVRGLLQITADTARGLGIDRRNPKQSIEGGARYLSMLWEDIESWNLSKWDRWFFALAAYNQGPRNLEKARELAISMGGDGSRWNELRTVYPLLSKQSSCRGNEAVQYVQRIRFYYYVLHGLVVLSGAEVEDLGSLSRLVSRDSGPFS